GCPRGRPRYRRDVVGGQARAMTSQTPPQAPDPGAVPPGGPGVASFFDRIRAFGAVRPHEGRWAAGLGARLPRRWRPGPVPPRAPAGTPAPGPPSPAASGDPSGDSSGDSPGEPSGDPSGDPSDGDPSAPVTPPSGGTGPDGSGSLASGPGPAPASSMPLPEYG